MMLIEKECEKALDNLLYNIGVARTDYRTSGKAKEDYHTLKSLIEEHFSNPTLTWEDIKEDMWCWDDREKAYIFIFKAWLSDTNVKIIRYYTLDEIVTTQFEDERFFKTKKEVGGVEE